MKLTKHEFAIDYLVELLQESDNYENFVLDFFIYWCENSSTNAREFQQILANSGINKWFLIELEKLENEFEHIARQYPQFHNEAKEMDKLQAKCLLPLMSIFPKALLLNAKKRELKTKPTAMPGILIESSILIQN